MARLAAYLDTGDVAGELRPCALFHPRLMHQNASIAKCVDHNTADVENVHSRNKRDGEQGDDIRMLKAKYVLRESASQKRQLTKPDARPSGVVDVPALPATKRRRVSGGYNSYTVFHHERIHLLSTAHPNPDVKCDATATHDESTKQWDALSPQAKQVYREAAVASNACGYNVLIGPTHEAHLNALEDVDVDAAADEDDHALVLYASPTALMPIQSLSRNIDTAGDSEYPIAESTFMSRSVSLPKLADTCDDQIIDNPPDKTKIPYVPSCLERGACYAEWRDKGWPSWRREMWLTNFHKMVTSSPVALWAKDLTRPHVGDVFNIQGTYNGEVRYSMFLMLGMYSLKPIWYKTLSYGTMDPTATFPITRLPIGKPSVVSQLCVPPYLFQTHGAVNWQRMQDISTALLTSTESLPITDELTKWYIYRVRYNWTCLVDAAAPIASITISGIDECSARWLDGPKPKVRAAPKRRNTAGQKMKLRAMSKPRPKPRPKTPMPKPSRAPAAGVFTDPGTPVAEPDGVATVDEDLPTDPRDALSMLFDESQVVPFDDSDADAALFADPGTQVVPFDDPDADAALFAEASDRTEPEISHPRPCVDAVLPGGQSPPLYTCPTEIYESECATPIASPTSPAYLPTSPADEPEPCMAMPTIGHTPEHAHAIVARDEARHPPPAHVVDIIGDDMMGDEPEMLFGVQPADIPHTSIPSTSLTAIALDDNIIGDTELGDDIIVDERFHTCPGLPDDADQDQSGCSARSDVTDHDYQCDEPWQHDVGCDAFATEAAGTDIQKLLSENIAIDKFAKSCDPVDDMDLVAAVCDGDAGAANASCVPPSLSAMTVYVHSPGATSTLVSTNPDGSGVVCHLQAWGTAIKCMCGTLGRPISTSISCHS